MRLTWASTSPEILPVFCETFLEEGTPAVAQLESWVAKGAEVEGAESWAAKGAELWATKGAEVEVAESWAAKGAELWAAKGP